MEDPGWASLHQGRRGLEDSAGVTCREAEKVIDMLTLEQNRKQDELQRLEVGQDRMFDGVGEPC